MTWSIHMLLIALIGSIAIFIYAWLEYKDWSDPAKLYAQCPTEHTLVWQPEKGWGCMWSPGGKLAPEVWERR